MHNHELRANKGEGDLVDRLSSKWHGNLKSKYFIYQVHVSQTFLFTPTLSSALYLTLLRLMYRDYEEVMSMSSSIATDGEMDDEEKQILNLLETAADDAHPNAHACFNKIALNMQYSSVFCPWDTLQQVTALLKMVFSILCDQFTSACCIRCPVMLRR